MDIPVKCAELFKCGYGKRILFAGGPGKITSSKFKKSEAEVYRDIAVQCGVPDEAILLETKSTNTGDNFRFSKRLLYQNQVKKILLVHYATSERRTLSVAKAILPEFDFIITSPELTFSSFLEQLRHSSEYFYSEVSLLVGDIQRMIIYPQLGWQEEVEIPASIIHAYFFLDIDKLGIDGVLGYLLLFSICYLFACYLLVRIDRFLGKRKKKTVGIH